MTDMREYKDMIRKAAAEERAKDPNWSWSVKAVNKDTARIGWGYLDYIGETDLFTVQVTEFDGMTCVIGTMPDGEKHHAFIGESRWDDAKTIGSGIRNVIHRMAVQAHSIY